jgi:hypothetical protein
MFYYIKNCFYEEQPVASDELLEGVSTLDLY